MRVRTEEKRLEIVQVASRLFERHGFDRTSMSMISAEVGGSKATLYGYFKSKEELFRAVIDYDIPERSSRLMDEFLSAKDLKAGFKTLGGAYLKRLLSPSAISNMRILASQPDGSTLASDFYERTLRPAWRQLTDQIASLMDQGRLKKADPWVATMQWKGLVEWDLLDKRLWGVTATTEEADIERAAKTAADAFMALYAMPTKPHRKRAAD